MSLTPFTPIDRMLQRTFHNAYDDFGFPYQPYWLDKRFNHDFAKDEVTVNDEKFAVSVDVASFRPNELEVAVEKNQLVIRGKHEQKTEHSSITRHFERRYTIPEGANEAQLKSHLGDDGKLKIEAPMKTAKVPASRTIPIEMGKK